MSELVGLTAGDGELIDSRSVFVRNSYSNKVYHLAVTYQPQTLTFRAVCFYGAIGSRQTRAQYYEGASAQDACRALNRKLSEKQRKGYRDASDARAEKFDAARVAIRARRLHGDVRALSGIAVEDVGIPRRRFRQP